jgi:hypothetical protein
LFRFLFRSRFPTVHIEQGRAGEEVCGRERDSDRLLQEQHSPEQTRPGGELEAASETSEQDNVSQKFTSIFIEMMMKCYGVSVPVYCRVTFKN